MSLPKARTVIFAIVVVFAVYAVINAPSQSADVTSTAWDGTKYAVTSVFTFFDDLLAN